MFYTFVLQDPFGFEDKSGHDSFGMDRLVLILRKFCYSCLIGLPVGVDRSPDSCLSMRSISFMFSVLMMGRAIGGFSVGLSLSLRMDLDGDPTCLARDNRFVICFLHRLYCMISVVPKEGLVGPHLPILLLV